MKISVAFKTSCRVENVVKSKVAAKKWLNSNNVQPLLTLTPLQPFLGHHLLYPNLFSKPRGFTLFTAWLFCVDATLFVALGLF